MKKNISKVWALVHLLFTLLGFIIQVYWRQYSNNVFYVGSLSCLFAFLIGAYADRVGLVICRLYSIIFLPYSIFAYIMVLFKGKKLFFFVMCVIDVVCTVCMFLLIADDVQLLDWISVGIQGIHAILFLTVTRRVSVTQD